MPPIAAQIVEDQLQRAGGLGAAGRGQGIVRAAQGAGRDPDRDVGSARASARWLTSVGITLPAYIGAMLVAAIIRNVDDATGLIGLSQRTIDDLGSVALSLFLVLALMTLRLWELAGLALPMVAILVAQVALIAAVCWPTFRLMGRDYDAAVMGAGLCGFMLGTTANAMANMEALVDRYGPAPRAFLVVPMVGAFFIDFINAVIITVCLNIWT